MTKRFSFIEFVSVSTANPCFSSARTVIAGTAIVASRLLHHAEVTSVEGKSYRVRESEQETAARRRKK